MSDSLVVELADGELGADLAVPDQASGLVVFAHGSGSSRRSGQNQAVARTLLEHGYATLLLDLLTEPEQRDDTAAERLGADLALLAGRVRVAVERLDDRAEVRGLPIGLFGASTGAAAALIAAADDRVIRTVVCRGGRPDLAGDALSRVHTPTLFIVGGLDERGLDLNRQAAQQVSGPNQVVVIDGAGHLFEEPGALEQVARHAADWFHEYLHR